jgi:predicted short-subunit dehydrogenase-like oxidoreductase (DUF2520 family)
VEAERNTNNVTDKEIIKEAAYSVASLIKMKLIQNISIVGSGNVAYHLGKALKNSGVKINFIYARNEKEGICLAEKLDSQFTRAFHLLSSADLVLLCIPDDVIYDLVDQIPNENIAYTSGSVELKQIDGKNIGVFYPLQTFRKTDSLAIYKVPFFIEASNKTLENNLILLAKKISNNVSIVSSEERKKYHLSAVFINNFTNHLLYLAKKEADKNGIVWENLLPLLEETLKKNLISNPFDNQTGPAKRNDNQTINKHLSMLDGKSKEIYQLITESIKSTYHD